MIKVLYSKRMKVSFGTILFFHVPKNLQVCFGGNVMLLWWITLSIQNVLFYFVQYQPHIYAQLEWYQTVLDLQACFKIY